MVEDLTLLTTCFVDVIVLISLFVRSVFEFVTMIDLDQS